MRSLFLALVPLLLLAACQRPPEKKEIADLRTFDYLGGDVRSGSVRYEGSPPAGGPYNALWQTCAVYTAPVYDEYAVHSLALGAIWVTYQPGLAAADLAQLKAVLTTPVEVKEGEQTRTVTPQFLMSPRENLPGPIVMTAWNAQIVAENAADERLPMFVDAYADARSAPERGATCKNGFGGTR